MRRTTALCGSTPSTALGTVRSGAAAASSCPSFPPLPTMSMASTGTSTRCGLTPVHAPRLVKLSGMLAVLMPLLKPLGKVHSNESLLPPTPLPQFIWDLVSFCAVSFIMLTAYVAVSRQYNAACCYMSRTIHQQRHFAVCVCVCVCV